MDNSKSPIMFQIAERSITRKNWDWRDNPIKIRKGQVWKKNDSGHVCEITHVNADMVYVQYPRKKRCHHLTKKDLLMFWKQL